jgi:signal transduction histidine kinase
MPDFKPVTFGFSNPVLARMQISKKIYLGFFVVIVLSLFDSWANFLLSRKVSQNIAFLSASETIIRNSHQLLQVVTEMQNSFRGYLLTDDTTYLSTYHTGLQQFPLLIRQQKLLLRENRPQLQKLDSLARMQEQWLAYADGLIAAKQENLLQPESKKYLYLFNTQFRQRTGKRFNDSVRMKFREMDLTEYQLRQKRSASLQESIRHTNLISMVLNVLYISIAGLAAFFITRSILIRISLMMDLAEEVSLGKFPHLQDNKNDELSRLSQSLTVMSAKLEQSFLALAKKNQELDQFAYVVSHDLKAPLRGMHNILTWIEEDVSGELSALLQQYHQQLRGRITRMEGLITGLLQYARIGRTSVQVETVSVSQLLQEISELLVPPTFQVNRPAYLPDLLTVKIYMEQVWTNLISNAVKYNTKERGCIQIDCTDMGDYYQFTIQDDGMGIDEAYHQKIFGIFQTLREKDEPESTGVGLAIVKKIVEDQGGTIVVRSQPDKGTTFAFTWPKTPVI